MRSLYKSRMLGIVLFVIAAWLLPTQARAREDKDYGPQEDQSVAALVASLRTPALREAVKQHVAALRSAPTTMQDMDGYAAAINFLYDLKADKVLLAFLHPYYRKNLINDGILPCLDICAPDDLPELYQAADAFTVPTTMVNGAYYPITQYSHIEMYWSWTVLKLSERTSAILDIKHVPIQATNKEAVRRWWVTAYNTAKQQGTLKGVTASTDKYFAELATKSYPLLSKLPGPKLSGTN